MKATECAWPRSAHLLKELHTTPEVLSRVETVRNVGRGDIAQMYGRRSKHGVNGNVHDVSKGVPCAMGFRQRHNLDGRTCAGA